MDNNFNKNYNEFEKDSKDSIDVKKDSAFYESAREKAMQDYLSDVGPISQYINEHMDQISKEKSSGIEK